MPKNKILINSQECPSLCKTCPMFSQCSERLRTRSRGLVRKGCDIAYFVRDVSKFVEKNKIERTEDFLNAINFLYEHNTHKNSTSENEKFDSADFKENINFCRSLHCFSFAFSVLIEKALLIFQPENPKAENEEV